MKYLIICFLFLIPTFAIAQANFWQQSNGPFGAYVSSIVSDSNGTLYAGTDGSGIFKSTDEGKSWSSSNAGLTSLSITTIAVGSDTVLFVGTVEGVFKSTNHAQSWERIDNWMTSTYTNVLLITRNGAVFVGTSGGGIYRSTNEGSSWYQLNIGLTNFSIRAFAENQQGFIFAGTEEEYHGMTGGGTGGLHRSTDGGNSWVVVKQPEWISAITVDLNNDVYAGTYAGQVYRSTNSGDDWFTADSGLPAEYIHSLVADNANRLYAGTGQVSASLGHGVFCSTNHGISWLGSSNGLSSMYINSIYSDHSGRLFTGTGGGGICFSTDFGAHWSEGNLGLLNTWIHSICVSRNGYIFAGTGYGYSGPYIGNGLFRSTDGGTSWQESNEGLKSSWIQSISIDSSNWVYTGTSNGVYRSTNLGATWMQTPLDSIRLNALAIAPNQSIFAGSYLGVYRSTDRGDTWAQANVGLEDWSVNCMIAVPNSGFIYAGTGNVNGLPSGHVFRTTDNGNNWTSTSIGIPDTYIYSLAVDSVGNLYAGTYDNGLFRSNNNGLSWENIGLPNVSINCIALNSRSNIYVGSYSNSGDGVFQSTDAGVTWNLLNNGLTSTSVFALAPDHSGLLFAGTYRQGVFRSIHSTTNVQQSSNNKINGFHLEQNYPNPFNPLTRINFSIPFRCKVHVRIFDLLGNQIATLVDRDLDSGSYSREWNGSSSASGVYFYRIEAGGFFVVKKMLLIK